MFRPCRPFGIKSQWLRALGTGSLTLTLRVCFYASDAGRAGYKMASAAFDEANKWFQELVTRYPETPNVHHAYGVFLNASHYPERALGEFRRELQISPTHVSARLYLAHGLMGQGDFKGALPYAEEAVKLAPNSGNAHFALGRALLSTGQLPRGVAEPELAAKLEPETADIHYNLARAYRQAGRKKDAARANAEFMRLDKIRRPLPGRLPLHSSGGDADRIAPG